MSCTLSETHLKSICSDNDSVAHVQNRGLDQPRRRILTKPSLTSSLLSKANRGLNADRVRFQPSCRNANANANDQRHRQSDEHLRWRPRSIRSSGGREHLSQVAAGHAGVVGGGVWLELLATRERADNYGIEPSVADQHFRNVQR